MNGSRKLPLAQAGAIPFRRHEGKLEILLITSRSRQRWIIPKGIIDPGYSAAETARKEAVEEAGITGALSARPVGRYTYFKWERKLIVQVFLLHVEDVRTDWEEAAFRERKWYAPEVAAGLVEEPDLKTLLVATPLAIETHM